MAPFLQVFVGERAPSKQKREKGKEKEKKKKKQESANNDVVSYPVPLSVSLFHPDSPPKPASSVLQKVDNGLTIRPIDMAGDSRGSPARQVTTRKAPYLQSSCSHCDIPHAVLSPPTHAVRNPSLSVRQCIAQLAVQSASPRISAALGPLGHRRRQQSEELRILVVWALRQQAPKWRHLDNSTNRSPAFEASNPGKGSRQADKPGKQPPP